MDDSEKPTLETEGLEKETDDGWEMPEPVFRSSTGFTPGSKDPGTDIPETGTSAPQSVRVKGTPSQRHKKKKGGCAKFFTLLAVLIGLLIGSAIVAVIYFLFYYRAPSTTF